MFGKYFLAIKVSVEILFWFLISNFFEVDIVLAFVGYVSLFSDDQIFATIIFRCDMLLLISPLGLELLLVNNIPHTIYRQIFFITNDCGLRVFVYR